jgi:hypothetical protein
LINGGDHLDIIPGGKPAAQHTPLLAGTDGRGSVNNFEETKFTPGETAAVQALRFIEDFDLETSEFKDLVASGENSARSVLRRDAVHTTGDGGYASAQVHRRL